MTEVIHRFVEGCIGPLGHVSGHLIQAVIVGTVALNGNSVTTGVLHIVSAHGLEVGQWTSVNVPDVGSTPRERCQVKTSAGSKLPLGFTGETELLDHGLTIASFPSRQELSSPCVERTGLSPGDAHDGVIIIGRVPEIGFCKWLVEAICEIANPAQGVRIDIRVLFDHELSPVAVASDAVELTQFVGLIDFEIKTSFVGCRLQVQPVVLEVQFPRIQLFLIIETV